jgi:hypothetical protein
VQVTSVTPATRAAVRYCQECRAVAATLPKPAPFVVPKPRDQPDAAVSRFIAIIAAVVVFSGAPALWNRLLAAKKQASS